jgi:ketosteroid isomerase-like protein
MLGCPSETTNAVPQTEDERPDAPIAVVAEFWRRMASNDFASVAAVLAPDFVLEWPQSRERIRGVERFIAMNAEYPAHGPWVFTVHRVVGGACDAVSDVSVTDGVQTARAVSFFTVAGGRIARMTEFWPEPFAPAAERAHLTERME